MSKYRIYKKHFIENLNHLASYDLQKLTWFPNDKGLSSDFLDDWCAVFEMSHLEDALYDDVIVFSREADQALRELTEFCDSVGYDKNGEELIDSPEMQVVREKAAKALALVEASDYSESTVEIVEEA